MKHNLKFNSTLYFSTFYTKESLDFSCQHFVINYRRLLMTSTYHVHFSAQNRKVSFLKIKIDVIGRRYKLTPIIDREMLTTKILGDFLRKSNQIKR